MSYTPSIADTSRAQLRYISEGATPGVTPPTPALQNLRFTDESLTQNIENVQSNEIREDRQISDLIPTGATVEGSVGIEFSYGSFDELIAAALMGTYTTAQTVAEVDYNHITRTFNAPNLHTMLQAGSVISISGADPATADGLYLVESATAAGVVVESRIDGSPLPTTGLTDVTLKTGREVRNGTTRRAFTIQKEFGDIGKKINFRGCEVSTLELNAEVGSILTGSLGFMGLSSDTGDIAGQTSVPASTTPVLNAVNNVGGIKIGGSLYTGGIQSFSVTIDNALRIQQQIGSYNAAGIGADRSNISGQMAIYFNDDTLYQTFINNQFTSFAFTLTDTLGNTMAISFPKMKFSSAEVVVGGIGQEVVLNCGFQAITSGNGFDTMIVTLFDA